MPDSVASKQFFAGSWESSPMWEAIPCTFALASGPLISVAYCLMRPGDTQGVNLSLAQGLRGVLCLMMVAYLFYVRRFCLLEHPLIRPLTLLAGYAVLTALLSPNPRENVVFAIKLCFLVLVFGNAFCLAEQQACSKDWLTRCAWLVLIFMAIGQVIGLVTGNNTLDAYGSEYATAGLTGQTAVTAAQTVSTMPVILLSFPNQWSSVGGVSLLLACVFFTMRRTELIAAMAAMCSVAIARLSLFRQRAAWGRGVGAASMIAILGWMALTSSAGKDAMDRFRDLDPSRGTGSGRYMFWRIALDHIAGREIDAQIVGEGMGAVRDVMAHNFGLEIGCHNDWLDMIYSFGVVGLVMLAWWYLALVRFIVRLYRVQHPAFHGALSGFVILAVISLGTGGAFEPALAVTYASLGFWAAQALQGRQ